MGRAPRTSLGRLIYHVLNRSNGRLTVFEEDQGYAAFERILEETLERSSTRILEYCLMPNHWHLVLWPSEDGDLSTFMRLLTLNPHPALAFPPPYGRKRACIPGAVQVFCGSV